MLRLRNVTFMSIDPGRLADFWSAALQLGERRDGDSEVVLAAESWPYPRVTVQLLEDGRARPESAVHIDLLADDRDVEVRRLEGLGATRVRRESDVRSGVDWIVMRDPDGNEFCVS